MDDLVQDSVVSTLPAESAAGAGEPRARPRRPWPPSPQRAARPLTQRSIPLEYRSGQATPVLSILIPAFNERATIRSLLERVRRVAFPIPVELVIVDDGSTDGTREVLARLPPWHNVRVVLHERNLGKGGAIQTAIRHARGESVVIQDADLELDPLDLLRLLEVVHHEKSPVCFGSRFLSDTRRLWRLPTYWANRLLNLVCNAINGTRVTDMSTCYKMMRADVARRLNLTSRGFEMEPEITTKLARMGIPIVERPISYQPRRKKDGKKIRWLDFFRYLAAMVRFRFASDPRPDAR